MGKLAALFGSSWAEYAIVVLVIALYSGWIAYEARKGPEAALAAKTAQMDAFVGQTRALGEAAQKAANARKLADQQAKESTDAQAAKSQADLDKLYAAYRKLRNTKSAGAGSGGLSVASGGSQGAAKSCLDTAAVNRALSSFDAGVTDLLEEGDGAIAGLNAARDWASKTLH